MPVTALVLLLTSGWETVNRGGDTTIERRALENGFYEVRVTTVTDVASKWIAEAYWNTRHKPGSTLKTYTVLSQTAAEKIAYLQLRLPIVKDRDYTVRITRYINGDAGLYQFNGRCVSDVGPPANDDHIRVTECTAQLTLEAATDGQTWVTYVAYANPAGQMPAWLANIVAPKAAGDMVQKLIELGRERSLEQR